MQSHSNQFENIKTHQDQISESGFTLIEVMVVVAIIGILVAVAVSQYQDYIARSRVVEDMNLSSSAKLAVTEAFASRGTVVIWMKQSMDLLHLHQLAKR